MYGCVTENVADGKKMARRWQEREDDRFGLKIAMKTWVMSHDRDMSFLLPLFFLTRNSFLPFMSSFSPFALSFQFKWVNFICHKNILITNKLKKWNPESHPVSVPAQSLLHSLSSSSLFSMSACFLPEYLKKVNNKRYQRQHSSLILDSWQSLQTYIMDVSLLHSHLTTDVSFFDLFQEKRLIQHRFTHAKKISCFE